MNKAELITGLTCLQAICLAGTITNARQSTGSEQHVSSRSALSDTVRINLARSTVQWKGTKMRGMGKHEGVVQLRRAFLLRRGGQLVGGRFVLDMRTIRVTDIPASEPIPLLRLTNHLKGPDFFAVDQYPTAWFVINGTQQMGPSSLRVTGELTLKGVTRTIAFKALQEKKTVSTTFTLDRFRWNIAYNGSWIDKQLVDNNIELTIKLQTI